MTDTQYRLVVQQDPDADGPLDWGNLGCIRTARVLHTGGWRDETPESKPDDTIGLVAVGEQMLGYRQAYAGLASSVVTDDDKVFDAIRRYFAIFHGIAIARWEPQGYSQSSWGDGIVWLEPASEREESLAEQQRILDFETSYDGALNQWYRGDVVAVILEERITWVQHGGVNDGAEREDWESLESIGGCYLGTGYTAGTAASEHFSNALLADKDQDWWEALPVIDRPY